MTAQGRTSVSPIGTIKDGVAVDAAGGRRGVRLLDRHADRLRQHRLDGGHGWPSGFFIVAVPSGFDAPDAGLGTRL